MAKSHSEQTERALIRTATEVARAQYPEARDDQIAVHAVTLLRRAALLATAEARRELLAQEGVRG